MDSPSFICPSTKHLQMLGKTSTIAVLNNKWVGVVERSVLTGVIDSSLTDSGDDFGTTYQFLWVFFYFVCVCVSEKELPPHGFIKKKNLKKKLKKFPPEMY